MLIPTQVVSNSETSLKLSSDSVDETRSVINNR